MFTGCPSFGKPRGGTVDPDKDSYEFGESVVVFCRQGFTLIGDERLICLRTGVWSEQIPKCSNEHDEMSKDQTFYEGKLSEYLLAYALVFGQSKYQLFSICSTEIYKIRL